MFDLSELDRWDEALASLASVTPVQTPERGRQGMLRASPMVEQMKPNTLTNGGGCPFGYGGTTHDG